MTDHFQLEHSGFMRCDKDVTLGYFDRVHEKFVFFVVQIDVKYKKSSEDQVKCLFWAHLKNEIIGCKLFNE